MKNRVVFAELALAVLTFGCGGNSTSDSSAGKGGTGGHVTTGGTGGSGGAGATGATGGVGAQAGSGGVTDAAVDVMSDGSIKLDGESFDGGVGIACGSENCTPTTQMCCVSGSAPSMQCVAVDVVGPKCDFAARCDGAEDCGAGESCCMPSGAIIQTYCAKGACPAGQMLCHTQSDCTAPGDLCCYSLEFGWPHSACMPGPQCPS